VEYENRHDVLLSSNTLFFFPSRVGDEHFLDTAAYRLFGFFIFFPFLDLVWETLSRGMIWVYSRRSMAGENLSETETLGGFTWI